MQDDRDHDPDRQPGGIPTGGSVGTGNGNDGDDGQGVPNHGPPGIVRLASSRANRTERILTELRASWDMLRGNRAIPERTDIEPRALRGAINHAFILERIARAAGRLRLAGRHLIDLMGMEVRGMPLCALFNPPSRGHLSDVLETVFAGPQIVELTMASPAGYARPELTGRMLILPLKSDLGDVTRALGAVVSEGSIGCPPRRFDLLGEVLTPVIDGARTLAPSPSRPGFAEPPEPWRPPVNKRRRDMSADERADPGQTPTGHGPNADDPGRVPPDAGDAAPAGGARDGQAGGGTDPAARRKGFRVIPGGR